MGGVATSAVAGAPDGGPRVRNQILAADAFGWRRPSA
jgi:hypothetical protein